MKANEVRANDRRVLPQISHSGQYDEHHSTYHNQSHAQQIRQRLHVGPKRGRTPAGFFRDRLFAEIPVEVGSVIRGTMRTLANPFVSGRGRTPAAAAAPGAGAAQFVAGILVAVEHAALSEYGPVLLVVGAVVVNVVVVVVQVESAGIGRVMAVTPGVVVVMVVFVRGPQMVRRARGRGHVRREHRSTLVT